MAQLTDLKVLLKIGEIVLGTIAFAITAGYSTTFTFLVECAPKKNNFTVEETIAFPFNLSSIHTQYDSCDGNQDVLHVDGDFSSYAIFFVVTGVLSVVYGVAAVVLYCFLSDSYSTSAIIPKLDIGGHVVLGVLWFAANVTWAVGLSAMYEASALLKIIAENENMCQGYICTPQREASYTALIVSIVLGFLCMLVWWVNTAYLFIKTPYLKGRTTVPDGSSEIPSGQ